MWNENEKNFFYQTKDWPKIEKSAGLAKALDFVIFNRLNFVVDNSNLPNQEAELDNQQGGQVAEP